jgi:hypothetical protein
LRAKNAPPRSELSYRRRHGLDLIKRATPCQVQILCVRTCRNAAGCSFGPAGCLTLPPTVHHHIANAGRQYKPPRYQASGCFETDGAVWPLRSKQAQAQRTAFELAGLTGIVWPPGTAPRTTTAPGTASIAVCGWCRPWRLSPSGPACTAASTSKVIVGQRLVVWSHRALVGLLGPGH